MDSRMGHKLRRRTIIRTAMAGMAATALSPAAETAPRQPMALPDKPNVLLVMADDQGYGDLGCHGNKVIRTPALDALHAGSVRFADFHVAPYCSPTRASLMTGRMPTRTGVTRTYSQRNNLDSGEVLMPEFFRASGYATALLGKWHLGANSPFRPTDRGFDFWFGLGNAGQGATSDYWGNDRVNDHFLHNGRWEQRNGYCTDIYFEEATKFMGRAQGEGRPFFVYLATSVPHFDWNVPEEWLKEYAGMSRDQAAFYAGISRIDKNMGGMIRFLKASGLHDNTLILFLTDNGSDCPDGGYSAGMRGKKGSMYDGGHRVPLFISGPERLIGKPRDIDQLAAGFDLLPTLVDLCRLEQPDRAHKAWDGISMTPLLKGLPSKAHDERTFFLSQQNGLLHPSKDSPSVVLTPEWRLINDRELYAIKNDPGQQQDVSAQNPEVLARLRKARGQFWREIDAAEPRKLPAPVLGRDGLWLTLDESAGESTWSQSAVAGGRKFRTEWNFITTKKTSVLLQVRRWPLEFDVPMDGHLPEPQNDPGVYYSHRNRTAAGMGRGKALPVAHVRLTIGEGQAMVTPYRKGDSSVDFAVDLPVGQHNVRAEYLDARKQVITGAYYMRVTAGAAAVGNQNTSLPK
ncbi:MAG: arylsulfatase [Luteolibacter sp.]